MWVKSPSNVHQLIYIIRLFYVNNEIEATAENIDLNLHRINIIIYIVDMVIK